MFSSCHNKLGRKQPRNIICLLSSNFCGEIVEVRSSGEVDDAGDDGPSVFCAGPGECCGRGGGRSGGGAGKGGHTQGAGPVLRRGGATAAGLALQYPDVCGRV